MSRMALNRVARSLCETVLSFARARRAGGMLIGCGFALALLSSLGAMMSNYAWQEAQWEELRSALRAAVSAAAPLLGGAGSEEVDEQIEQRVGDFIRALLPALDLDEVEVSHDPETGITTVTVRGQYGYEDIWVIDATGDPNVAIEEFVAVRLELDRYEVGIALDVSSSMDETIPDGSGGTIRKIDALKLAIDAVADSVEATLAANPGAIMTSVVPFGTAVNVADTCNPDPGTGLCQAARSAGKERYLRMLTGVHATMDDTLAAARDRGAQWVDMYHQYGATDNLGPLAQRSLPQDLLDDRDWNLRRTDVEIDLRAQAPNLDTGAHQGLGYWRVNDEDFWNGCVMARWGAYWDPKARRPGWTPEDPGNWPAATNVPGWSTAAGGLADAPLHLSDAPPDPDDPKTLYTAYSWPDARINGTADHRLQSVMADLLGDVDDFTRDELLDAVTRSDNDWSIREDGGGAAQCPPTPITPLTDDLTLLRAGSDRLEPVLRHGQHRETQRSVGGTYLHLGIVWALRSLSPLWLGAWSVQDSSGAERPGVPCAPGEAPVGCDPVLHKSILIVTDGKNESGRAGWTLSQPRIGGLGGNPFHGLSGLFSRCRSQEAFVPNYHAAVQETMEDDFISHFNAYVDASGKFDGASVGAVADLFHRYIDADYGDHPPNDPDPDVNRRTKRMAALQGVTPWQVFRGIGSNAGIQALVDPANAFDLDGRPVQFGHLCRRSTLAGSYGRADDRVRVGDDGLMPPTMLPPVEGVAPFSGGFRPQLDIAVQNEVAERLDGYFDAACHLAGSRRVKVNAVYLEELAYGPDIDKLKQCVQESGGDPDADVYVAPSADALRETFVDLFTVRRKLKFLD